MKKLLLTVIGCCFALFSLAQSPVANITVKGVVIDSADNKPVGYVTVAIQDAATKQPVKSSLTKDDGSFQLSVPADKKYNVALVFVGYSTKVIPLAQSGATINIGSVKLVASTSQLKEVGVVAVKPLMKQEVDRISYDIQADPDSKANSALDMMRKVPLLTVDGNDNIKLKGSGNYKILINGKESALMAKSPSDVLKSMPATNIEKIEVITTPPAKYDAEGLTGIINIITKKNADQGYNIGINGRYNTAWGPGLNLNGNAKVGKFGVAAYTGFGHQNKNTTRNGYSENIYSDNSSINQSGTNTFTGGYHYGDVELSYDIDSLNLLTGSFDFETNTFNQNNMLGSTSLDASGNTTQFYNQKSDGTGSFSGMDAAINYQLGFKKNKDQLLTFSYKYAYSPNKNTVNNTFDDRVNYPQGDYPDFFQYNRAGSREHTAQVDYAQPFKKLTLEAGAKAILRNNFSDYHRDDRDSVTQDYITNDKLTDNFNYHQDVYSLYNSYQYKMEKWTAKAGLRLEHTTVNADFTSSDAKVDQNYNNLIPSVSIQRSFKNNSLTFGFTQRIQRPSIYQLNPYVDNTNPKFISTGNPNLRPELNNTFELNYSAFGKNTINLGLSYAFSNNSIQNVSSLREYQVNGATDTATFTTYQNLGSNKTLGLNVNTNIVVAKDVNFSLNGQVSHIWLKGAFNGHLYTNDGFTGNLFGSLNYKFGDNKSYRFGINSGYFSGDVNLQGSSTKFIFSQYVLAKEFLKKSLTLSLVANNPYSKYQTFHSTTRTDEFYQTNYNQNIYRNFAIRFNYKFGKLTGDIKRNQHGISNDDTKGGGKTSGGGN